jgi:hypothetical protein
MRLSAEQFSTHASTPERQQVGIAGAAPGGKRRDREQLYILIEAVLDSTVSRALHDELLALVADTYQRSPGSVTRALSRALEAVNAFLFERNLRADSSHHVAVGITCAVLHDGEVHVGQVGPALAYLVHGGQVTRYPEGSIWLQRVSPRTFEVHREPPAGFGREMRPNLFQARMAPGAALILATTSLARDVGDGAVAEALEGSAAQRQVASALAARLRALAGDVPVSALIIACDGEETGAEARLPRAELVPAQAEMAGEPAAPGAGAQALGEKAHVVEAPEGESEAGDDAAWAAQDGEPHRRRRPELPRIDLDLLRAEWHRGTRRARHNVEELLMRVLPDSLPERPQEGPHPRPIASLSGHTLVAVALTIPLVTLVMVVMTRVQYDRTRRAQFVQIQAEAQALYDAATSTSDPHAVRAGLRDSLATIDWGLAINPNDDVLLSVQRRIEHRLDEVNTVERLFHFWQLAELSEPVDTPAGSGRIIIHDRDVFLLNRGSDRVYKFALNDAGDALQPQDSEPVLMERDELRGGIQVGQLVDIAWVAAGGQRSLSTFMALESNGSLLAYDPQQGIDVLPVADSDKWLKPAAIGGYFGNLYVLDPLQSRIMKYVPVDNAYTSPPSDYLDLRLGIDLTGAVDLAIDGNMYVLFADGAVKKFYDGVEQPFALTGLPDPMRSPTTLFVSGEQEPDAPGYLYVSDSGNERVLQFDKNGTYLRQFMTKSDATQFRGLRGIYVDEEQRRMYVLSGRTLWLTDIPPLGAP